MRKIIVDAMISLDGVMQAPGGPTEDPTKGFKFGGFVLGGGKRLFADGSAPHSYKVTGSRISSTGVMIAHYERAGGIKTGGTELDSPSDRERARQERMKREG